MDILGFMLQAIGIILLTGVLIFVLMAVLMSLVMLIEESIYIIKKKGGKK